VRLGFWDRTDAASFDGDHDLVGTLAEQYMSKVVAQVASIRGACQLLDELVVLESVDGI
jgi:hypothetical protein